MIASLSSPTPNAEPLWKRLYRRASRGAADMMIFTALCALELADVHRVQIEQGTWHKWVNTEWPLGEEAARMRVKLGEYLERKLSDQHTDDLIFFLEIAKSETDLTDEQRTRALAMLQNVAPLASSAKQLFIECGVLAKPPEKPQPVEPAPAPKAPRAPRPKPEPYVRLGKTWERFEEQDRLQFIVAHLPEIRELLARLEALPK